MEYRRKRSFTNFNGDECRALAFIVTIVVVATLTYNKLSEFNADRPQSNKENRHGAMRRDGSPYVVTGGKGGAYYAQEDIGFGDGSVSATDNGLADRLFPFDPNTADSTTLLRLGLKPWQVRGIYRYRAHGGRFRKREDFARLHGLTLEQYHRLEPYITIRREVMAADVIGKSAPATQDYRPSGTAASTSARRHYPQKLALDDAKVDINTADTTLLKRIPGIGSYFARRIVELRQRRKTFVTPEDLLAIRNFPEHSLAYMTASHDFPPLRVNSMTEQELQSHPLLTRTQAKDITALRRTSGSIRSTQDMMFLPSFTPEQLTRLSPFLVFD